MSSILTLLIGFIGGSIAWALNAPLPFLTGPAASVTIAALTGLNCRVDSNLKTMSFIAIGIGLGSGVDPSIFRNVCAWPITLIGVVLNVALLLRFGSLIFQKIYAIDRTTAMLASTPGHLSYVLSLSEDAHANSLLISVIQSIRVLTLTLAVPATIMIFTDFNMTSTDYTAEILSHFHFIVLLIFSVILGYIFKSLSFPAPFLIGGMVSSTFGHSVALTPGSLNSFITTAAFIILGSLIGSRFTGVKLKTLKMAGVQGAIFTLMALALSLFIAWTISTLTNFTFIEILIAIAPGGFETMLAMGTFLKIDPTFITFHHLGRIFLLSLIVPIVLRPKKES